MGTAVSLLVEAALLTQAKGCLWTIAWTAVGHTGDPDGLQYTTGLRVSEDGEVEGLDAALHGEALHEF